MLLRPLNTTPFNANYIQSILFGSGEQGVIYVPVPRFDGQQILYQDAAATTPVTADGDPVGFMRDLSGNGNNATQSTSAARPLYRTDGTLHWLEFDGVDDALVSSALGDSTTQPNTMAVRAKANSTSGGPDIVDVGSGTTPAVRNQLGIRSGSFEIFAGTILSHSAADLVKHTFYAEFNGSSSEIIIDESAVVGDADTGSPAGTSTLSVGSINTGNSEFLTGNVYGAIYIDRALSDNEEQNTKDYLNGL